METQYSQYSWFFIAMIMFVTTANQAQRFCLAYIATSSDLISDTNTSTVQFGILMGPAFLFVYALTTLPAVSSPQARLVDYLPKLKFFLVLVCIGFSASTALTALATSFWGLLWPRVLFGLFTACLDPITFRLLALYFPPEKRGLAYGLLMVTIYLGSAFASLCILLALKVGWRASLVIIGILSAIESVIPAMLLKDQVNFKKEEKKKGSVKQDFRELVKNRTLIYCTLGNIARYTAGFSRGFYEAIYMTNQFPDEITLYSILNAFAISLAPISFVLMGIYTDKKEEAGDCKKRPLVSSMTNFIPVPFLVTMYLVDSFPISIACVFIVYLIGEVYINVSLALLINVTTPRVRALRNFYIESSMLMCTSFAGGSVAAIVLGVLDTSTSSLRLGMLSIVPPGYFLAGVFFYLVVKTYPKDYGVMEEVRILRNSEAE